MAPPPAVKNFHQHQPITTGLRTICEAYPPGTCLRELLQNADDAGATVIEYVLDTNSYLDGPLLYHGLKEYHGPALLARNNSVFTDADFASLSSVGDSRKRHEASSTGKFGQGFNAVYHWTDGPWVYSRNWLLLLDPHERWSVESGQPGGPTWDVVEERGSEEIQNHLKTFQALNLDVSREIDETIIRIPLRTKAQALTSKIVEREITVEEIKGALHQFAQEVREGGLLFLKHIQTVSVRINNDVIWEAKVLHDSPGSLKARQEIPSDFKELFTPVANQATKRYLSKFFNINVQFTVDEVKTTYQYLVHHTMTRSSGHKELDQWARERKLFAWVAVAAPIEHHEAFVGRLFSTLRLPILTAHPVHLHGLFSITPDRGRLTSSEQSPGSEDFATKWNSFLFASCIASAWADLLRHRSSISWNREGFGLWPRVTELSISQWDKLADDVIDEVAKKDLPVWPTANKCVSIRKGFFSRTELDTVKYAPALTEAQAAAVYLEQPLFEKLQQRCSGSVQIIWMTPKTVRHFLRFQKPSTLSEMPHTLSKLLLEYCLLDVQQNCDSISKKPIYDDLGEIALWPTMDGKLSVSGKFYLLLPRDSMEMELFARTRKARTIDINHLTSQTLALLRKDIALFPAKIRYRRLVDLSEDWPTIYPLAEPSAGSKAWTSRSKGHGELTIGSTWTWICARLKEEGQLPPLLDDLWLLPTNNFRLRRYAPGLESQPLLIITKGEPLYELVEDIGLRDPNLAPPVLYTELLPAAAVKLLKKNARSIPKLNGACVDHLDTLLTWLVAGKELFIQSSDEQKRAALQHIETLTRSQVPISNNKRNLPSQLRSLPIFSRVSSTFPFTRRAIKLCDLHCSTDSSVAQGSGIPLSNHVFEAPIDLPPIPEIPGVSLYDLSNQSERYVVKRFKLIEDISLVDLLKHHLLPWAVTVQEGSLITAKEALIEFTFNKSRYATEPWAKEVSKFPIIPLPLTDGQRRKYRSLSGMIDPTSGLSRLYFGHEDVFPCPRFFEQHKEALKACGISSDLSWNTPLDRVRYYSQCGVDVTSLEAKVKCLLQLRIHEELGSSESSIAQIRTLRWLPGFPTVGSTMLLFPSQKSRGFDESDLVDRVLGTTRFLVNDGWKKLLGWDARIELHLLLRQLDFCLADHEHGKVDRILSYLQANFDPAEYYVLKSKACILGVRKNYLIAKNTFGKSKLLERHPMAPYLEEVDGYFAIKHVTLLSQLGVREEPGIRDILDVQALLKASNTGPLEGPNLDVAISSLEIAVRLLGGHENPDILVPDTGSTLRALSDIVYRDHNMAGKIAEFNFTHPSISTDLIQRLGIEHSLARATRLEIDFEDEDEDEYTPREKLSTIISDTLGRYPVDSTFNEFLANADDCHATRISWVLDRCENGSHESLALLTSELKSLQGPALFMHNDQVFTEQDFAGFKEIGQGGKSNDETTTGMFGRGALTMYHFTDVPLLISGEYILILDPQQELLPRNMHFKRKAGVKLPLKTARRLCQDQLAPFNGICHYSKDLDYYNGTLFRFPLRTLGTTTTLTDSVMPVNLGMAEKLLQDYFLSARRSLLFLRHVKSISFRIRGQREYRWSVVADYPEGSEDEVFRRVKISTTQEDQKTSEEVWRVGLTDIEQCPVDIVNPGRGSHKISECGVAACLSCPDTDQKVFCKLPTPFDLRLPISYHASFAITGDRRSIPWEDRQRDTPIPRWNNWLLTSCIPDFYLDFLKDLAPRIGIETFNFWPSTSGLSLSPFSEVVAKAFWTKIMDHQHISYEIYPKASSESLIIGSTPMKKRVGGKARKLHAVTSLECAQFDLLPEQTSEKLRPLFIKLCPNLVRPPRKVRQNMRDADTAQHFVTLTPAFFCGLFGQDSSCTLLEEFLDALTKAEGLESKSEALEKLLQVVVPPTGTDVSALKILDGCRILPKLDGSLGLLTSKIKSDMWTFVATEEEQELFCFASRSIVNTRIFRRPMISTSSKPTTNHEVMSVYRNPIEDIMKAPFNVRPLEIGDFGTLLAQHQSPISLASPQRSRDTWIMDLWAYVNTRLRALSEVKTSNEPEAAIKVLLSKCDLEDQPVYRYESNEEWNYITPRQFDEGLYVLDPLSKKQSALCKEIRGLRIVDRGCVPFLLAETESDLTKSAAFERLVRVLAQIENEKNVPIGNLLSKTLSEESILSLQFVLLKYLRSGHAPKSVPLLQRLPVWPSFPSSQLVNAPQYIPAEGATFCKTSKLLLPWVVKALDSLVSPEIVDMCLQALKALGVHVMPIAEIWSHTQQHQPRMLRDVTISEYSAFIQELADNKIFSLSTAIAPNGHGIFCKASSLYDHEDELFRSAFRLEQEARFLHRDMQQSTRLLKYWISLGLRSRRPNNIFCTEDYVQCAIAIQRRWQPNRSSQTLAFREDAEKVAAYLDWDKPSFREWPDFSWMKIAKVRMFCAEEDVSKQPGYRRNRMGEIALRQDHYSLLDIGSTHDVRILWSQFPLVKKQPAGFVLENLPRQGRPTAVTVFEHLKYMVSQCKQIDPDDLAEYVKDIQASYEYLQENSKFTTGISGIQASKIFFNTDTTDVDRISTIDLEKTLTSAKFLCLNSPVDAGIIKVSRKFLVPYEKLLRALGCKSVVQPTNRTPRPFPHQTESPLTTILKEVLSLRDEGQLIDVVFEAEGREKPAHRIFMAAVSDYCRAQFSGEWGLLLTRQAKIQIEDMSFMTLSQMVDFAYTSKIEWPRVQDPGNNDEIAMVLDELLDLLQATDMWFIQTLHTMTENTIIDNAAVYIRPDNVESVRDVAKEANASGLVSHCDTFIADNLSFVEAMRGQE